MPNNSANKMNIVMNKLISALNQYMEAPKGENKGAMSSVATVNVINNKGDMVPVATVNVIKNKNGAAPVATVNVIKNKNVAVPVTAANSSKTLKKLSNSNIPKNSIKFGESSKTVPVTKNIYGAIGSKKEYAPLQIRKPGSNTRKKGGKRTTYNKYRSHKNIKRSRT
jgi:hypothetical protein